MNRKTKRPPSVWISQIVLVLFSILGTVNFPTGLRALSTATLDRSGKQTLVVGTILLVTSLLILGFVAAFWGLSKRRPWGRWLTVAIFAIMMTIYLLSALYSIFVGSSRGFLSARELAPIAIVVLLGVLTYRLAHRDDVNDFFNPRNGTEEMFEPPSATFVD